MGEVAAPERERLLRSKRDDLSGIVASRKRKLRELYAICDSEGPIPQVTISSTDAPSTTPAEKHFLEVSDILQGRHFDESNLPTRRQLRSSTAKQRSPIRKKSPEIRPSDASRKAIKSQRDEASKEKRLTEQAIKPEDASGLTNGTEASREGELSTPRSPSKGSQTDQRPDNSTATPVEPVRVSTPVNAQLDISQDADVQSQILEDQRIRSLVESPAGSPGADPRKVLPITAEETVDLPRTSEPLGSNDTHHKAATIHLPPQEVQEAKLQERKQLRQQPGHLSINLPPRDNSRVEPASSPSSTVGAHSAATPIHHEASTDTSPENDNHRYETDRLESKDEEARTPQDLRPSPEEIARKEQHDRIQQAQIEVSRRKILGDDAVIEDAQSATGDGSEATWEDAPGNQISTSKDTDGKPGIDLLTSNASEVVGDVIADQDEVDTVASRKDGQTSPIAEMEQNNSTSKPREVADSEGEDQSPVIDAMDIDVPPSEDSKTPQDIVSSTVRVSASRSSPVATLEPSQQTQPGTTTTQTPVFERMTTRVSSGALRQKPVSEILGQIPSPNTDGNPGSGSNKSTSGSRSATPQSSRARTLLEKSREKERSKLSTVVFPSSKRSRANSNKNNGALVSTGGPKDDYLTDLFIVNAMAEKRGTAPLDSLIASAHKTITTSNAFVPIIEHQTMKVLKRIYNLQSSHKWSLRQPKRSPEPIRPTTHWDVLLQEAKWMQTDFKEERKWKMAAARNLATACAEWVNDKESRPFLQLKTVAPKPRNEPEESKDVEMAGVSDDHAHDAAANEQMLLDDFDEEPQLSLLETVSPAAIFALQDDDIVFGLRQSPTSDKLLSELPMYGMPLSVPPSDLPTSELDPDRLWKRPALAMSKFVDGRMELKSEKPPRKRSRFEYDDEDEDEDEVIFDDSKFKMPGLPPTSSDVALFNPDHKHIRDRIHSSHQFRPPSEFPMPQQSFFECRASSQWTWAEDDDLKGFVKQYSYNWSLIASLLSSKSLFASGAERRTPWECFERWIHLEGLPADMQKTHYFRTYTNRIETANRNVMMQAAQVPPPPTANGQIQQPPPPRKRPTTSVRVDRRRNQKHLTIVDAMRKLAKKRETSVQKQQHAAGLAAMRKANEVPQVRGPAHTPQDFSRLKAEREEQMKERMIQLQQRQEAQRRAALLQQRNAAQGQQQPGLPPNGVGPQQQRAPAPGSLPQNGIGNPNNQNLAVPGQNRPRQMPNQMPNAQMQNGLRAPQMTMNGVPAVPPMHGIQGQLPLPNPALNVDLVARAQGVSEQQRRIHELQQRGQLPAQTAQMQNSPPRMNGMPQPGFQMPNNMMPPFNGNVNGVGTPPANMGNTPGAAHANSPRMGQALNNGGGASHIKILEQQFRTKFPEASPEQLTRYVNDHVNKAVQQQQHQRQGLAQSAMNAAAGSMNASVVNMNAQQTPQLYAQMLRQQQELQQQKSAQQQQQQGAPHGGANGQNTANGPAQGSANGQANGAQQGHAHRASSGSVQSSGK